MDYITPVVTLTLGTSGTSSTHSISCLLHSVTSGFAFPDDLATPTGKETNAKLRLAALRYSLNAAKSGSWEVWSVVRCPLLIPGHATINLLKRQPAKFVDERIDSAQVLVASMVCSRLRSASLAGIGATGGNGTTATAPSPSMLSKRDRVGSASVYWSGLLCA
jgi:hypothetical protein